MSVRIRSITIDCKDPYTLSLFWSEVTGFKENPDDPNLPEHTEDLLVNPDGGPNLLFIKVPEDKVVKNRIHLDLSPSTPAGRDAEMDRVLALGATFIDDHRRADGGGWVVLADPEGNEFCIERGLSGG
jgi:catechol 2,3-dioxygenase-like lactoylglutathione lyase family enzyme